MVMGEATIETQVAVIGGGPGGYAAAFHAADRGLDVTLIDRQARLGGVCLFQGCIPSKVLLYLTELILDAGRAGDMGVRFGAPEIDVDGVNAWKDKTVERLGKGLMSLGERRDIQILEGDAVLESSTEVRVQNAETTHVTFEHAILATGSHPRALPRSEFRSGGRIMSSDTALALADIPDKLLVVGAGHIGIGLASVYAALGSQVTIVEQLKEILPGVDRDLVRPLERHTRELFAAIHTGVEVTGLKERDDYVDVTLEGELDEPEQRFDRVLVAIGRTPNSSTLGLDKTQVQTDEQGFVQVDEQCRTADERIYAVGDLTGGMMLAHKALYEGVVAAGAIAGEPVALDARAIPTVIYTHPAIAWAGLTEQQAKELGRDVLVTRFPWRASGRALTNDSSEGLTKLVLDPDTRRILGIGIVGRNADELIAEGVLAIEMGAVAEDLAFSVHPHPTLSETVKEAAAAAMGAPIHILPPR